VNHEVIENVNTSINYLGESVMKCKLLKKSPELDDIGKLYQIFQQKLLSVLLKVFQLLEE
jgi:hypothetical protein